jgi:DNA-binding NtrC family response regulator
MTMTLEHLSQTVKKTGPLSGRSPAIKRIFRQIRKAASIDIPILIQGETGTGKELVGRAIHQLSGCAGGPYVPVNLSALPSEIVASELFGHERGAFTGAAALQKGKFEQAQNGTLFLDEIESIDEKIQVTLLRVLEQRKFYRLGGKRRIATNARITAASNESLRDLVAQGIFREDLFYRLDIFPIQLPPLRKRPEDVPDLLAEFIVKYNQMLKKQITSIDADCVYMLQEYDWPGNIRELKNVVQRAVLLCDGPELRIEHFPSRINNHHAALPVVSFKVGTPLEDVERSLILHTLEFVENNRTEAADLLGISRRALYNRLNKYDIK